MYKHMPPQNFTDVENLPPRERNPNRVPCANFYCAVQCKNTVSFFGDRCKLCVILRSGQDLSYGLLPEYDADRYFNPPRAEQPAAGGSAKGSGGSSAGKLLGLLGWGPRK